MNRVIAIFLICFSYNTFAQSLIQGKVSTTDDRPLAGATIQLSGTYYGTVSNAKGEFTIKAPKDSAVLEVSFIGYKKKLIPVSDETSDLVIQLNEDTYLADDLIVSATRAASGSPLTHENISKEEIQKRNSGKDMPYILNQSVSVVSMSDAGAGIGYTNMRIRGIDQANINVTINGISLNDAESHGVYWVDLPDFASGLSDIQIQRGVGTSTNGAGAFGATINLQTDELHTEPYGELMTSFGSFNTLRNTVKFGSGMLNERWYVSGRLSTINSDGYVDRATTDMKSYSFAAGFNNGKTSVKALVFGGVEDTYQAWYGLDSTTLADDRTYNYAGALYDEDFNVTGFYDNEIDHYEQDHLQLHLSQKIGAHFRLNLAGHLTYGRGYYEQYRQAQALVDYGVSVPPSPDSTLSTTDLIVRQWLENYYYGMTYNLNYTRKRFTADLGGGANRYDGDHYGRIMWAQYAGNSSIRRQYYFNKGVKDDINIYLKLRFWLGQKTSLFLDYQNRIVSYEISGTNEFSPAIAFEDALIFQNPKVGVDFRLGDNHEIYYTFGIAHREPNRNDYLNGPGFDARPERLYDNELGYRGRFKKVAVNATAYMMYYQDQLVLTGGINDVGEPIRDNVGESYRTGLELWGEWAILKSLVWKPGLTYSVNRNINYQTVQSDGSFETSNTPIAYSPSIIEKSTIEYTPFKFLRLSLLSRYVGEQYLDNTGDDAAKLPAYQVHDARLDVLPKIKRIDEISFFIGVYNIFNTEYMANGYMYAGTPYYFPQAGLNYMVGMRMRL